MMVPNGGTQLRKGSSGWPGPADRSGVADEAPGAGVAASGCSAGEGAGEVNAELMICRTGRRTRAAAPKSPKAALNASADNEELLSAETQHW